MKEIPLIRYHRDIAVPDRAEAANNILVNTRIELI